MLMWYADKSFLCHVAGNMVVYANVIGWHVIYVSILYQYLMKKKIIVVKRVEKLMTIFFYIL